MIDPLESEEPRRRDTSRRAILEATQALLLEGGSERISIRRVSERCGFKAPTIYHHFRDKTGLIDALLEERFALFLERLQRVPRGADPVQYLRELARAFVEFGLDNPSHYALLTAPRLAPDQLLPSAEAARELVFGALAEVVKPGTLRTPDLESAFQLTWVVLHGVVSLRISRPGYAWSEDLVELALDVIERGLLGKDKETGAT
jgi:AcrR family transcriptional regulator